MANNSTIYTYCSTLAVGCPVWNNPERTLIANPGIYSIFDYNTQGTRYVTVGNGTITSIDNLCPIGPGSVIATVSGYGTGIIEVTRGDDSTIFTPFHTIGRDWIEARSSNNGQIILAIRNLVVPEQAGKVEASFNYGVTFSNISSGIDPSHDPIALGLSAGGGTRIVATSSGYVYHNLGTTPPNGNYFKPQTSIGFRNWTAIAMNAFGNIVIAAANDGTVWRYVSGDNWVQSSVGGGSNSWTCLAMNYSGSVIWLAGNNTHLYRSTDGGQTFIQIPITVTIPNVGNISSPFNFSNLATDNLGNNSVATIEPSSNSANLGFIAKNFIGGSVNYDNWSWAWGFTGYYPYNQIPNGSWTGLAVSSNAATIYAANNSTQGGIYISQDSGNYFYNSTYVKPYSSVNYVAAQNCPANGTLLSQYCDGTTWTQVYANGGCGTYTTVEYNSPNCQSQSCDTYSVFDYNGVSYIDCYGVNQFNYFVPGDYFCALTLEYGPAYLYQAGCNNPGILNPV